MRNTADFYKIFKNFFVTTACIFFITLTLLFVIMSFVLSGSITETKKDLLNKKRLYIDGGMGTLLQKRGLQPGEKPESWNLTHPDDITDIHLFLQCIIFTKNCTFVTCAAKIKILLDKYSRFVIINLR